VKIIGINKRWVIRGIIVLILVTTFCLIQAFNTKIDSSNSFLSFGLKQVSAVGEDISNTPNSIDFGVVNSSSQYYSGLSHFAVTNNSGFAIDITIQGTDMTGGVTWTLSDTATPDTNVVGLIAGTPYSALYLGFTSDTSLLLLAIDTDAYQLISTDNEGYCIIIKKNSPYNYLVEDLPDGETQYWGFELLTPTGYTDVVQKSGTITITASAV
jgi:hypothetical protein